jgi:hypothetical protein
MAKEYELGDLKSARGEACARLGRKNDALEEAEELLDRAKKERNLAWEEWRSACLAVEYAIFGTRLQ